MKGTDSLYGASMAVQGFGQLGSAILQGSAAADQGEYQKTMYEANSRMADIQADDAIRRGSEDASAVKKAGKKILGAQRTGFAAQGVAVDSGTAAAAQEDTRLFSKLDEMTVTNNAWREAWGFKSQAANYATAGGFAKVSGDATKRSTLLTGGLGALSSGLMSGYAFSGGKTK